MLARVGRETIVILHEEVVVELVAVQLVRFEPPVDPSAAISRADPR